MKKLFWGLLMNLLLSITSLGYAQVGINTEDPSSLVELEISNLKNNNDTIPRGIIIPRMSKDLRDQIDVNDKTLANSLLIYNLNEDCYNFFSRKDGEWKSLCGDIKQAEFEITNCSGVKSVGDYYEGEPLGTGHFIVVPVKVNKSGTYKITAFPNPQNGYYFSAVGEFLSTGNFEVVLQGAGTPINATPASELGDKVEIRLNDKDAGCFTTIKVGTGGALYTVDCNSVSVNGIYKLNKTLDNTNTISLSIIADPVSEGKKYEINTGSIEGISFSASGRLVSGAQSVTLKGSGIPVSANSKVMPITCNTESGGTSCSAVVNVVYTKKKLLTIGSAPDGFGYNFSGTAASNKLITTASNYGTKPDSKVQFEGFTIINGGVNPSKDKLKDWLLGSAPVDLVILGYNNMSLKDVEQCKIIKEYLENEGVVLAFQDNNDYTAQPFLRTIFGDNNIKVENIHHPGSIYKLASFDHEILNGPFGDIRNKQWGEDASYTQAASGLPLSEIMVLSTDYDMSGETGSGNKVTGFIHKNLNLMWIGDGGFNSNHSGTSGTICPFKLDNKNYPIAKPKYGRLKEYSVYNSVLTANAIAWAIKNAEFK